MEELTNEVIMPTPSEEHGRLAKLAGVWEGEDILLAGSEPRAATGRVTARVALSGFHLFWDYQQTVRGRTTFEGHAVFGWDARGRCYTMYWFDSFGVDQGSVALGTWEGGRLEFQHETRHMGLARYRYDIGEGEYEFHLETSRDGREWISFIRSSYRRLNASSRTR